MSKKIFNARLFRYMCVGATATLVDAAIFALFVYYYNYTYSVALGGGFVVGVLVNFLLCDKYIFDRTGSIWQAGAKHYAASFTGFCLNQVGMLILISGFEFKQLLIARIVVAGCTFIINFVLIQRFVFTQQKI